MADTKPAAPSQASASKSEPESKPAEKPQARAGDSLGDEIKASHNARVTVPGREGVDARLDNRRPEELEAPPTYGPNDEKPQQVDGPDLAGQLEHTRKVLADRKKG